MERASTTNGHSETDAREQEMCGGRGMVTVVQPTFNVALTRERRRRESGAAAG